MQNLASIALPVTLTPKAALFPESAPPALWILLSGEVALESSTGEPTVSARAGDVIGSVNTMAGHALGRSAKVGPAGIALKIDREDLFDLLGERPELLRQMFAAMFSRRRAPSAATTTVSR
jgi:CRP-like cAMP-binding protein